MNKRWIILPKKSEDIIEQLLINRKIPKKDWRSFLKPNFNQDLPSPFLLKDMKKATTLINQAIQKKLKIGIFSDYDADGATGAAILTETLKLIGAEILAYIPMRDEGYGLNKNGIKYLAKQGCKILITVDCGVKNPQEISLAKKLGMKVIIIDHHEPPKKLPKALAIINPKIKNQRYPEKEMAAGGLCWKFAQGLQLKANSLQLTANRLKWLLDLAAIATFCDMIPLTGENRLIAYYGLIVLRKARRLGLKELYNIAGILPEKIDTYIVGFQIGPRLNAPGRIDQSSYSYKLLISDKKEEARLLAIKLDQINRERQEILDKALRQAEQKVKKQKLDSRKIIMIESSEWPTGIVGLVAGKIMEKYARPVIALHKGKKDFQGSARSIEGFHILNALDHCKAFLVKHGGHAKAAGLTLEQKHLSTLYDKLLEITESKLRWEDLVPKISIDAKLELKDLKLKLHEDVKQLAPFGLGNPRPVFMIEKAEIFDVRTVGRGEKHLKFRIKDSDASVIGFDLGEYYKKFKSENFHDLVFTIDKDTYNDNNKLQLKVLDLRPSKI